MIRLRKQKQIQKEKKKETDIYHKAYNLLGDKITTRVPKIAKLEQNLLLSMLPISYHTYVSAMVLFAIIGLIAGLAGGVALAFVLNVSLALKIALPIVGALLGAQFGFAALYVYPSLLVNTRKRMIAEELPYFISYMSMLCASGMTPEAMFRTIAAEESKEAIVQDARMLVRNVDLLGMDFVSALRDITNRSPLTSYTEMLEGMMSTIRAGGDLNEFFSSGSRVMMEEKKLAVKKFGETLGMLAEIYTIMLVVFPLMAMIMLAIMAIMSKDIGGIDIMLAMNMVTYIFVPIAGIMVILIIESMMPKR
jgi:flagellar protein FlaJ